MSPDEFDAWQQAEQARQHREDIIHSAAIRAALCAARGLSESQACHPPGCPDHSEDVRAMVGCEHCAPPVRECQMCGSTDPAHRATCEQLQPGVCDWTECDTEGGSHD